MNDSFVVGHWVYVCNDNSGIDRIDLADPDQPVRAPALRFEPGDGRSCRSLAAHAREPVLYMSDVHGIEIYAIGPSGELTLLGDHAPPFADSVGSMVVADDRLIAVTTVQDYPGGSSDGRSTHLQMFDLVDPSSPVPLWRSESLGALSTLTVAGQTLFAGGGTSVSVYDISGTAPELEGSADTQSVIRQLTATREAVYIAQSTGGLGVLRTGPLTQMSGASAMPVPALPR